MTDFPAQNLFLEKPLLTNATVRNSTMTKPQDKLDQSLKNLGSRASRGIAVLHHHLKSLGVLLRQGLVRLSRRLRRISGSTKKQISNAPSGAAKGIGQSQAAATRALRSVKSLAAKTLQTTTKPHASTQSDGHPAAPNANPEATTASRNMKNRVGSLPENECVYAIGDIHGRFDLLEQLVESIEADARTLPQDTRITLVFLGDYIDRGMQSRDVVDFLIGDRLSDFDTIFLMGNHEEALLQFRQDSEFGAQWARYGGGETLYSYGLQPPKTQGPFGAGGNADAWRQVWDDFRLKLPVEHLEFFQSLKHYFSLGDYLFVHAGLKPDVPLEQQTARDMLWIRDEFLHDSGAFEHIIVHGHTPADDVHSDYRRIGLDTGAYYSGQLSAARLYKTDVSILST